MFILKIEYSEKIKNLILRLMVDEQIEVRMAAANTLSGLIHCNFLTVDQNLKVS